MSSWQVDILRLYGHTILSEQDGRRQGAINVLYQLEQHPVYALETDKTSHKHTLDERSHIYKVTSCFQLMRHGHLYTYIGERRPCIHTCIIDNQLFILMLVLLYSHLRDLNNIIAACSIRCDIPL